MSMHLLAGIGEIMHLNAFGQGGIVLLNSHAAAVDLLDRRGGDYKYRPRFIGTWAAKTLPGTF